MSFLRHREIYRSDGSHSVRGRNAASRRSAPGPGQKARPKARASLIVHDEFPVGYSSAGCSPAEPASASPTTPSMRWADSAGNPMPASGNLSLVSVPQRWGSVHTLVSLFQMREFGQQEGTDRNPPKEPKRSATVAAKQSGDSGGYDNSVADAGRRRRMEDPCDNAEHRRCEWKPLGVWIGLDDPRNSLRHPHRSVSLWYGR